MCRPFNKCYGVDELKKEFQRDDFYQKVNQDLEKVRLSNLYCNIKPTDHTFLDICWLKNLFPLQKGDIS